MKLSIALFLVCGTICLADQAFQGSSTNAAFSDAKGEMKMAYGGDGAQCKLEWNKLIEKRTTNSAFTDILPENSDAGLQMAWRATTSGPYSFEGEHHFTYNSQERVLEVKAYIGSEDRDIQVWHNRTMHAYKNQLKFTFRLRANNSGEAWAWNYGADGEMCIGLLMGCHANEQAGLQARTQLQLQAGNMNQINGNPESTPTMVGDRGKMLSSSLVYINNGTEQVMNQSRIQFREQGKNGNGGFTTFSWCFPHFNEEVVYDPTIELISASATSNVALLIGIIAGSVGLVAIAVVGIVCYRRKSKSKGKVSPA